MACNPDNPATYKLAEHPSQLRVELFQQSSKMARWVPLELRITFFWGVKNSAAAGPGGPDGPALTLGSTY